MTYEVNEETLQDIINIETKLFYPLTGFMDSKDYNSVINEMQLSTKEVWTIPITLDVNKETFTNAINKEVLTLTFKNKPIATLFIEDLFKIKEQDIKKIFQTDDINHPGVKKKKQISF